MAAPRNMGGPRAGVIPPPGVGMGGPPDKWQQSGPPPPMMGQGGFCHDSRFVKCALTLWQQTDAVQMLAQSRLMLPMVHVAKCSDTMLAVKLYKRFFDQSTHATVDLVDFRCELK